MKWISRAGLVLSAALAYIWWEYIAQWVDRPATYRLVTAYLVLGVLATAWNLYAVRRFHRMVKNVRKDEKLGLAEVGSTMFAINQRFRYMARTIEALTIIAVSVMGILALNNAHLRQSATYVRLVVTYLLGSVSLTAYLTYRDMRVINAVRKAAAEDAATLRPILRYRSGKQHEEEMEHGSES